MFTRLRPRQRSSGLRRRRLTLLLVPGLLIGPVASIVWAGLAPTVDDELFVQYTRTETRQDAPPTGEDPIPDPAAAGKAGGSVEIRCAGDECRLLGVQPERFRDGTAGGIPIELDDDGRAEVVQTALREDTCDFDPDEDSDSDFGGVLTVAASAADIRVTWTLPSVGCFVVGDGPGFVPASAGGVVESGIFGEVIGVIQTWSGDYLDGDPCLPDPSGCATVRPSDPSTTTPIETESPTETESPSSGAEGDDQTTMPPTWNTPSVFSDLRGLNNLANLEPVPDAGAIAVRLCVAAALAVILVLLIVFPTSLLNSAVETALPPRTPPGVRRRHLSGWWQAALGVVLAAVISGFVDPRFGVNEMSARVLASILVAFLIDVLIGWSARIWLVRRLRPGEPVSFRFLPLTLFIVAGAVLLTRLTGFEPAIIFGLVAGIVFTAAVTSAERAHTELLGLGYGFVVALAAWAAYTLIPEQPPDGAGDFVRETLAATAIAGIAALPLVMFPVRGLPGFTVFRWRRSIWGMTYFLALFGFFVLLMPLPDSWALVPMPLITWVAVYVAYCVVAIVLWLVVRARAARSGAAP